MTHTSTISCSLLSLRSSSHWEERAGGRQQWAESLWCDETLQRELCVALDYFNKIEKSSDFEVWCSCQYVARCCSRRVGI